MRLSSTSYKKTSIKTKVTLTATITVTLLMVAVSLVLFSYFHSMLRESIFRQQFLLVSEIAEQLNGRIELARHQLSLAATGIDSHVLSDPDKLQLALTNASPANMIFDAGFLVIGTDGVAIAESMGFPELVGKDLRSRDYVRVPLQNGKFHISEPFNLSVPPYSPLISMVIPVRDNSDRIICLLAGYHSLGMDQFLTSLSSKNIGSSSYLYLLQGRTILVHPDTKRILETIPEGKNKGIDRALMGFEGSLDNYNSKGQHMLTSFKKVGQTSWILGANIPYDEAFKPLRQLAYNAVFISIFGIIISLGVVWFVTRRLTQPIMKLIYHLDGTTGSGEEWVPLDVNTGDELEHLATTFNSLMSELRDTRQVLADKKDFYRGIIQNAAAPMFVIDTNHTILFWNNSLAKLTGKSSFQMKNTKQQWTPFYDSKRPVLADLVIDQKLRNIDEFYTNFESSMLIDGAFQAEGWFENIGGQRRYMFFSAAPVMNSHNEIVAAVETLEDLTERKLAQEELANQNEQIRKMSRAIEQSPATILITDVDGIIEYVNPKFCQTTGYTAEEAIGQNPRLLKSGEMPMTGYIDLWKTISAGKEWRGEFHNKRKDGSLYWEYASISPLFDINGVITGYLAVKEDITARKAAEAELAMNRIELERSHDELEKVFEQVEHAKREWEETLDHLRDYIILTGPEHLIRRCNKILAEDTGRSVTELIGMDWRELIAEAGFSFVTFNGTTGEISNKRSRRSYDITIYEINIEGRLTGYVVSINDTTELRATTQELEKAYKELKGAQLQIFQQEKMASIGQLAAGVAHEINNPMGFISSNLSTLNKYIDRLAEFIAAGDKSLITCAGSAEIEKLNTVRKQLKIDYVIEDSRQLIAESQDGAGRVRRIVQDLKSFSRVDQAECAMVNLNEALETTINIAWNEIKYVATINREFGDIPMIKCFPQQLNQVFLNLLVNAAHAIGEKQGNITIKTWSEDEFVFVSVYDNGCGIPDDIQQRIFEPFFTTKEVGKGTGLGLSISYDIIKKHGGEIVVESEVGRGTTFIVKLPVDRQSEVSADS